MNVPLFVIDHHACILAGPPALRDVVTREILPLLARGAAPSRIELGAFIVTVRRVDDPDHPWYVVRLEPRLRAMSPGATTLTRRQLEVARLAALGKRCHEIGRALGCSTNTVRSHLRIIYDRLAVSNRVELMRALGEP